MGRLVAISNRAPALSAGADSGGLVVALKDAFRVNGGLWIGAAPQPVENPASQLRYREGDAFDIALFEASKEEVNGHYLGYSNSVLWPAFHTRTDLLVYQPEDLQVYRRFNSRMAEQTAELLKPDDCIWVHDYQMIPMARELRNLGVENRIGFFLHIPVPSYQAFRAIPGWEELARDITAYDVVGLQTRRDVSHLIHILQNAVKAEIKSNGDMRIDGKTLALRSFPISIDVKGFNLMARAAAMQLKPPQAIQLIGVDRLDYSKGLVQRFQGYRRFLEDHPEWREKVQLLQISPPSREKLEPYRAIRERLEGMNGEISGQFASLDWNPIHYLHSGVDRKTLSGLMRHSRVGLVTPLFDGMNLVAKEYVAAQDAEDPGVLVLSQFAGAAEEMDAALLVNPYDTPAMGQAIAKALSMPTEERRRRHATLWETLCENDIRHWTRRFLDLLAKPASRPNDYSSPAMKAEISLDRPDFAPFE